MTSKSDGDHPLVESQVHSPEAPEDEILPLAQISAHAESTDETHAADQQLLAEIPGQTTQTSRLATLTTIIFLCAALVTLVAFRESIFLVDKDQKLLYVQTNAYPQNPAQGQAEQQELVVAITDSVRSMVDFSPIYSLQQPALLNSKDSVTLVCVDANMTSSLGLPELADGVVYAESASRGTADLSIPLLDPQQEAADTYGYMSLKAAVIENSKDLNRLAALYDAPLAVVSCDTFKDIARVALQSDESDLEVLAHSEAGEQAHLMQGMLYSFSNSSDSKRAQKALDEHPVATQLW